MYYFRHYCVSWGQVLLETAEQLQCYRPTEWRYKRQTLSRNVVIKKCRLTSQTQFRCRPDGVVTQYCGNTQFVLTNLYRVTAIL